MMLGRRALQYPWNDPAFCGQGGAKGIGAAPQRGKERWQKYWAQAKLEYSTTH